MHITFSKRFKRCYRVLPPKVRGRFAVMIDRFRKDPTDPALHNHPLHGNLVGLRAFSVTGDYRVIYQLVERDLVKLVDIGRHVETKQSRPLLAGIAASRTPRNDNVIAVGGRRG